jgi:hypothetical protein
MTSLARRLGHDRVLLPALLVVFGSMICLRMPQIIVEGRFWCEEGNVFYRNAWLLAPGTALFNSFGGYLNLAPNAATLAARWLLPVAYAPYLTIALGLLVQLCPLALLLDARDDWMKPLAVRVAAILLILFVPAVEEIWLNSLHCQFQLTLCCAIILSLESYGAMTRRSLARYAVLLVAPLCGPGAIALLPLFALRTAMDRSAGRFWQTVFLAVGSFLQLALFFHHEQSRSYSLDPSLLLNIFTVRHLYLPYLGIDHARIAAAAIEARRLSGHVPLKATLLPILVFGPLLVLSLLHRRTGPAFWFLTAGGLVACASYYGAIAGAETLIDARNGGRYVFVPQALFSLALLALAVNATVPVLRLLWVPVIWLLCVGGYEFVHPWQFVAHGPPWRDEVDRWEQDPSYKLHVWYGSWTPVSLPASAGSQ